MPGTTQTTENVKKDVCDALGMTRDLPERLDECHVRIAQLEDAVTREVEKNWNLMDRTHEMNEKKWVDINRHKAMVGRMLTQIPLEWIRRFIYIQDSRYTTVLRSTLETYDLDEDGEY